MGLADNYLLQNKDPTDAFFSGIQKYQTMQNNDIINQTNQRALNVQDQADLRNQQAIQDLQGLDHTNATALQQYNLKYGDLPVAKNAQAAFSQLQAAEQKSWLSEASKGISLFQNGGGAMVVQNARDKAKLYAQGGNATKAKEYNDFADLAEKNPQAAYQQLLMGYSLVSGDKAGGNLKSTVEAISPQNKIIDGGDKQYNVSTNPLNGNSTTTPVISMGTSPKDVLQAQTQILTTGMTNNASRDVATINGQYGIKQADVTGQWGVRREGVAQEGQNQRTQAQLNLDAQKLYFQKQQAEITNRQAELKEAGGKMWVVYKDGSYKPALDQNGQQMAGNSLMTAGGREKVAEIQGTNDQLNQTIDTLKQARQLSDAGIYEGYAASGRADLVGNFGGTETSKRTQEYTNLVTNNALASLKAIFGGNPTEGERAILLKVQASPSYPADVRRSIIDQAIMMAKAKVASNNRQIGIISGQPNNSQDSTVPAKPANGIQAAHKHMTGD